MSENLNRPKSRLVTRRRALHDITDGVDENDMFILTIDNELRTDNLNKIKRNLNEKNYDSAIDELARLTHKINKNDEDMLYSMVIDDLDKELQDLLKNETSASSAAKQFKKSHTSNTSSATNNNPIIYRRRNSIQASKCIPIIPNRKTQDLINSCSYTSSSPA